MRLIEQLACNNSEAKVVESDYYYNVVGDKEKGRALLKTALIMTHERGEYGIAGIYRRLGDFFAIDNLEIHKKVAGAFYGLSIFWGDDLIQNTCREHAKKYSTTILNTKEAAKFLKEHNIQVGFSADMQTCARQIKEVYGDKVKGTLERSIRDITTSAMLIDTMC